MHNNCEKSYEYSKAYGMPIIGPIENMSYLECSNFGEKVELYGPSKGLEVAEDLGMQFLSKIP
ncbi:MAG: P-loop NTPase [Nitrososphaerales archaeon]